MLTTLPTYAALRIVQQRSYLPPSSSAFPALEARQQQPVIHESHHHRGAQPAQRRLLGHHRHHRPVVRNPANIEILIGRNPVRQPGSPASPAPPRKRPTARPSAAPSSSTSPRERARQEKEIKRTAGIQRQPGRSQAAHQAGKEEPACR